MKTEQEVLDEIRLLHGMRDMDESGLVVRMVTMVALEWVLGRVPVAPSDRIVVVNGEILDGVVTEVKHGHEGGAG